MSIEQEYGRYIPVCDGCGENLAPQTDFDGAVEAKRAAGWKSHKERGEWVDCCPECREGDHG